MHRNVRLASSRPRPSSASVTTRGPRSASLQTITIGIRPFGALVKAARARSAPTDEAELPADRLQFGEVEPWDHPVDGQEVFDEIVAAINRHVVLGPGQATAVASWIMMSWLFDRFKILPQLLLCSPVKRCGKTTLLEVISYLVARPLVAANLTGPAVFRSIEMYRPALLIDEADTFLGGNNNPELTGILNSGHNRATAFVVRVEEIERRAGARALLEPSVPRCWR